MANLTASQKSQLAGISKTLGSISAGISSLSPSEKKKFESSASSNQLSSALGGLSTKVSSMGSTPVTPATEMNTPAVVIPPKPVPANLMGTVQGANASVAPGLASLGYTLDPTTGQYTYTAPKVDTTTQTKDNFQSLLEGYLGNQPQKVSAEDTYNQLYKQSGIAQKEQQVQSLTNQLNAITKSAESQALALEGQGRGQTTGFLGGEGARIQREAAIQALPLTAQLAAAQGDLQTAQKHLDTLYTIRMQDAQNEYEYKSKIVSAVYDFATKAEQRKLDAVQRKEDQAFELKKGDIAFERQKYLDNLGFQQSMKLKDVGTTGMQQTLSGKPQTASQSLVNSYANRMIEANKFLTSLGSKFTGTTAIGGMLPNIFQSKDRQSFEQAKRNFATAVLRRESGAAISQSEFDTLDKTYFPQAGDKPNVVAQKQVLRNLVINNFYKEANVPRPTTPGDVIESGGKRYLVGTDGETLTEI